MLIEIQLRLEAHFDGLSRERLSLGYPVYVFEHGLQTAEINSIRRELCNQLARARTLLEEIRRTEDQRSALEGKGRSSYDKAQAKETYVNGEKADKNDKIAYSIRTS